MATTVIDDRPPELNLEDDRFLRYSDLHKYGIEYSRQHLRVLEDQGQFPKRYQLSERVVAWRLSEIREWMTSRCRR
jgi:predicted DNA-binding transcriptional regulator AlpA